MVSRIPEVGDEVDVTIDSMAFGGQGVARCGNYVLFVPDVIPGEKARVRITATKRSYGRATPARIIEPSPDRIEPSCAVYGICGGCQYQHVAYERSLKFKEQQLEDVVLRIGGLALEGLCDPIRPAPEAYGYRNVVSLRVRKSEEGWVIGYCARDNTTLVPIRQCPIASAEINGTLADMVSRLRHLEDTDGPKALKLKRITVKNAGGQTLLCPSYRGPLRRATDEVLTYRYKQLALSYGPRSFFQVNHSMIPDLLDAVRAGLDPLPGETLFDLYAGVGLFSIALADNYGRVIAIEAGREAVDFFEKDARDNGIPNATVVLGTVEAEVASAYRRFMGGPVSVVADPPREGMKAPVIRFLNRAAIRRLVYVSCNPSTLARDLKMLSRAYSVRRVTPLDLFPQTMHLEAVAVLEKERPTGC